MDTIEQFSIVGMKYPEGGYCVHLSSTTRGQEIFNGRGFVNDSGYRDIEIVPKLLGELAWAFGSRSGRYAGVSACFNKESVTKLLAFKPQWQWGSTSTFNPLVAFSDSTYVLRPKSKIDIADLTDSEIILDMYFLPRFPDTSLVLKLEDDVSMLFIHDLTFETVPFVSSFCTNLGVTLSFVESDGPKTWEAETIDTQLKRITDAVATKADVSQQIPPLSTWYYPWLERLGTD